MYCGPEWAYNFIGSLHILALHFTKKETVHKDGPESLERMKGIEPSTFSLGS